MPWRWASRPASAHSSDRRRSSRKNLRLIVPLLSRAKFALHSFRRLEDGGFTAFRDPPSYGQSSAQNFASQVKSRRKPPKIDETAAIIDLDESPDALKATDPMKA